MPHPPQVLKPLTTSEEPYPTDLLPDVPVVDPTEHTIPQKLTETFFPMFVEVSVTFPLVAMTLDRQAGQKTVRNRKSLLRGYFTTLIGEIPRTGIILGVGQFLGGHDDTLMDKFEIAMIAGLASGVSAAPIELIVTQQRLNKESANAVIERLQKTRGLGGSLFRGATATVLRQAMANIGFFVAKPWLEDTFFSAEFQEENKVFSTVPSAFGAGAIGAALAIPFDVARGEIQRIPFDQPSISTYEAFQNAIKRDGSGAIWKGYSTRALQYGLAFGLIHLALEEIVSYNTTQNEHNALAQGYQVRYPDGRVKYPVGANMPTRMMGPSAIDPQTPLYAQVSSAQQFSKRISSLVAAQRFYASQKNAEPSK